MTVDDALNSLDEESVQALLLCFENQQAHFVVFDTDRFVGVHCSDLPNLILESVEGFWCVGRISTPGI